MHADGILSRRAEQGMLTRNAEQGLMWEDLDDDDDDDDDHNDLIGVLPGARRQGMLLRRSMMRRGATSSSSSSGHFEEGGERAGTSSRLSVFDGNQDGLIRLPLPSPTREFIPSDLVVVVVKTLLLGQNVNPTLIFRVLQNISNSVRDKDLLLKLLLRITAKDLAGISATIKEICGADGRVAMTSIFKSEDSTASRASLSSILSSEGSFQNSENADIISKYALLNIISILKHLASGNNEFVFLLLAKRVENGALDAKTLQHWIPEKSEPPCSFSVESTAPTAHGRIGVSTRSLLESFISLFDDATFQTSSSELELLASLVALVTSPLESLSEAESGNAESEIHALNAESRLRDEKNGIILQFYPCL